MTQANFRALRSRSTGFTIIELLIVIVVIGILASIILVTYNSVQTRAQNLSTVANIKNYITALEGYKAIHGRYPAADGEGTNYIAMVCLGKGYKNGTCGVVTGTNVYESDSLQTALSEVTNLSSFAPVNKLTVTISTGETFTGAAYGIDTWGQPGRARTIQWVLKGSNQPCGLTGAYIWNVSNGNTACEIDLEQYSAT